MLAPVPLQTTRLGLRRPTLADAPDIFARYASDPEVPRYLTWPVHGSVKDTEGFLATLNERDPVWAIAQDGRAVGMIGLHPQLFGGVMLGYVLMRALWGQGHMSEVVRVVSDYALSDPEVHRLWACVDADNPASGRVLEKAGFVNEARLQKFVHLPAFPGAPRDVLSYIRLR
jgi:ribosomal-protein-alanine N-acetyltransferase